MTTQAVLPTVEDTAIVEFTRARGAELYAENGRTFIDFFCGAGTLPYGHNNPYIKRRLAGYVQADGLTHGLDVHTAAKSEFLGAFQEIVLAPRELRYKVRFCTDAVATAVTLARKATGRHGIVAADGPQGTSDSIGYLERILADSPAAVIVEPVQLASGVHPAPPEWLRGLRELTERTGFC